MSGGIQNVGVVGAEVDGVQDVHAAVSTGRAHEGHRIRKAEEQAPTFARDSRRQEEV